MGYIEHIRKKLGHDPLIIVGASVFIYRDGEVLLQRRSDNGRWGLHGGCMELGESTEQTARRELFEETGLVAGKLEFLCVFSGAGMDHVYPNGDQVQIVDVSYVCRDFSGELHPQSDEVIELKWFSLDAIPENVSTPDRGPMAAFLQYIRNNP